MISWIEHCKKLVLNRPVSFLIPFTGKYNKQSQLKISVDAVITGDVTTGTAVFFDRFLMFPVELTSRFGSSPPI